MAIPKLLTAKEAAGILRISRNGVMNLIPRGELPGVQVPGAGHRRPACVFMDEEDLCEYIRKWKKRNGKSATVLVNPGGL